MKQRIKLFSCSLFLAIIGVSLSCNCAFARQYLSRKSAVVVVSDDGSTAESKRLRIEIVANCAIQHFGPMKSKIRDDTLVLMIPVPTLAGALFVKKPCQSMDLHVEIPKGVKRVTFAGDDCEIWPRDLGARVLSPEEQKAVEEATKHFLTDFNRSDMNRVTTIVFETLAPKTQEPCYSVRIHVRETDMMVTYYISKNGYTILRRVEQ